MRKVLVIAIREYIAAVRSKAFIISLLFMPVMMFGGLAAQSLLKQQVDLREKRFAIVDRTPGQALYPSIEAAVRRRNAASPLDAGTNQPAEAPFALEWVEPSAETAEATDRQRFEISERVRRGELFGFLEIGREVLRPAGPTDSLSSPARPDQDRSTLRYQTNRPMAVDFSQWVEQVVNADVQQQRASMEKLDWAMVAGVIQPVPLRSKGLTRTDSRTGAITEAADENPLNTILVPMGLTVLMLMMLMVGTSPLMQSVMEEKMLRIAEVLLGSVRPFQIMAGKLIGMVGVSLTSVGVYLSGAFWAAHRYGYDDSLTLEVIGWFLLFQVLGVVMYGSLFIAIGAACSDAKDVQTLLMPVMILATAPIFALTQVIRDPNSTFATWLSFFPFGTPMLMTARIVIPPGVPAWQPPLGVLVVLATTAVCVYAGGRIFRVGLLMQGKGPNLADLVKWVIRG